VQLLWHQFIKAPRAVPQAHLDGVEVTSPDDGARRAP